MTSDSTVLFLKEDSDKNFTRIERRGSITLHDLSELYNISSVLECDQHGTVQPRTMLIDTPAAVLHRGNHYIVRRDVNGKDSRVTFQDRVLVKEFEISGTSCIENIGNKDNTPARKVVSAGSTGGGTGSIFDNDMYSVVLTSRDSGYATDENTTALPAKETANCASAFDITTAACSDAPATRPLYVFTPFVCKDPVTNELTNVTLDVLKQMCVRDFRDQQRQNHNEAVEVISRAEKLRKKRRVESH